MTRDQNLIIILMLFVKRFKTDKEKNVHADLLCFESKNSFTYLQRPPLKESYNQKTVSLYCCDGSAEN